MKLPEELRGIDRTFRGEYVIVGGIAAQDAFCEDTCHDVYEIGSDKHTACLDNCRD